MIKQFLKIAGVKTEKDLLRKYKTEAEFFAKHPEAEMLAYAAMGGSYYADGGGMPPEGMPPPDQGQGGGGDAQLQEIIKFIVQSLQQGMAPEQIMAKLVEMGVPQDQAGELIQSVMQKLQEQGGGQQGGQEQMMQSPEGQQAPPQEMAEGQPPMQRYGGLSKFPDGGEPCTDEQGNVVDCEELRLKQLGSDAFTAMDPFYETLYGAANKYKNERTGMVSDFNSARATAKAFIKHPNVLFMKRHRLPSEITDMDHNPYGVQSYTTPITGGWYPSQWAQPRRERNTGDGSWWQEHVKNPFENFKEKIKTRRGIRRQNNCYGANCTEAEMQDQARYGGMYDMGGEPCPGEGQIRNEQGTCVCGPEYDTDPETGQCIKKQIGGEEGEEGEGTPPPGMSAPPRSFTPRGGFNAGFGLQGKNYNFDYGFNVGADMKSNVAHNLNFNIPKAFRTGVNSGDINLMGRYVPGRSWNGSLSAGVPLSGLKGRTDLLRFTGGMGQEFTTPSSNSGIMTSGSKNTPLNYNAGIEYLGNMFGEKGPKVKLRASYNKQNKYGGLSKFVDGGAPQQGGEDQQQQLMQQIAQALQQGMPPEQVMQQLVKMGMPQDQAQQIIQMIMQQMQGGAGGQEQAPMQMYGGGMKMGGTPCYNCGGMYEDGGAYGNVPQHGNPGTYAGGYSGTSSGGQYFDYGGPYIPLYNGGGDNDYRSGGSVKKYKKGGEYEMSHSDIQALINKGYKIQYL